MITKTTNPASLNVAPVTIEGAAKEAAKEAAKDTAPAKRAKSNGKAQKANGKAKVAAKGRGKSQKGRVVSYGKTINGKKRMFARQAYDIQTAKIVSFDKTTMPANRAKCLKKGRTVLDCRKAMEKAGFSGSARRWIRKAWQAGNIKLQAAK